MNAAIYARKSTDQNGVADDQKSIARQIDHARQYAASKGWVVLEEQIYVDDGISGAEFANRPGFLRLMNSLKPRPPFQVLVMSEESRLGREAIETAYALKQLVTAGVRVFFYLEDRERTLDTPTDKIMMSLTAFADELEREKARQRTYDAMLRKARAGHVTGGRVFGYDNVEMLGIDGKRSHVERRINEAEAVVIRRIFELSAEGNGLKAIAKALNDVGTVSPRAQRGRSQSWAPTSVRDVLHRDLYRGVITWNRTRKRNQWGIHQQRPRPSHDWLELQAPDLRIVPESLWTAARDRMASASAIYFRATAGKMSVRPALRGPSKYLLSNLALCGCCGGPLKVCSRSHGSGRKHFYGCGWYHERGRSVCRNAADVPMEEADLVVLEALLDDVLDKDLIAAATDEAVRLLRDDEPDDRVARLELELEQLGRERANLAAAIASGGQLDGLLEALRTREAKRQALESTLLGIRSQRRLSASDAVRVREEVMTIAQDWRTILADDPTHARPIVSSLLKGRVTIAPLEERRRWRLTGEGTLSGLFERMFSRGETAEKTIPRFGVPRHSELEPDRGLS